MALKPYAGNPSQRSEINDQDIPNQSPSDKASRIWNVFKPTIVLDELSIVESAPDGNTQKNEDYSSLAYPLIKINDYIFSAVEILSFNIDSRGFLPMITLTVSTANKLFLSRSMPKDGDIISVMIRNKNDILKPIRNDYVITGVPTKSISTNSDEPNILTFFGELFIPGLKSYLGSSSFQGYSMDALKEAADRMELGFNTNEEGTDDYQIWIISTSPLEFIEEATSRAWKDENSFFDSWIDVYYNLNFINIQKILLSQEDNIDPAAFMGNINIEYHWGSSTEQEKMVEIPKALSNFESYKTSSNFVTDWKPSNRSSAITFDFGTSIDCSFFEHLDVLYTDPESKKYWNLHVSPDYDPKKVNSHILLRGRPRWDPSTGSNINSRALANYNYSEIYKRSAWLGIQYTVSNSNESPDKWNGNQHPNYMRAQVHNLINLIELDKINLDITVKGVNNNIIKGDKIPLILMKSDPFESSLAEKGKTPGQTPDYFYSGWFYVKGFNLSWTLGKNSNTSSFSHTFVLTRREWSPPELVDPIKDSEANNSNI